MGTDATAALAEVTDCRFSPHVNLRAFRKHWPRVPPGAWILRTQGAEFQGIWTSGTSELRRNVFTHSTAVAPGSLASCCDDSNRRRYEKSESQRRRPAGRSRLLAAEGETLNEVWW